jgi:hypothetical protein
VIGSILWAWQIRRSWAEYGVESIFKGYICPLSRQFRAQYIDIIPIFDPNQILICQNGGFLVFGYITLKVMIIEVILDDN